MPWHIQDHNSQEDSAYGEPSSTFPHLVIYFCDQGMRGGQGVMIRDANIMRTLCEQYANNMRTLCEHYANIMRA